MGREQQRGRGGRSSGPSRNAGQKRTFNKSESNGSRGGGFKGKGGQDKGGFKGKGGQDKGGFKGRGGQDKGGFKKRDQKAFNKGGDKEKSENSSRFEVVRASEPEKFKKINYDKKKGGAG